MFALVTGASSGIGRAIAIELARRGYSLIVTARRTELLDELAVEVRAKWRRSVECISADLTSARGRELVVDRVRRDVEVLVANAGFSTRGSFVDLPLEGELLEIQLNVVSVVELCHAAAASMRERRSGRILITSSAASFQPLPGLATYSATKAFLTSFAQSLDGELRPHGVTVSCLAPGYVARPGSAQPGPALLWTTSDRVAREAVSEMLKGRSLIVPGIPWKLAAILAPRVPRAMVRGAASAAGRRMVAARNK